MRRKTELYATLSCRRVSWFDTKRTSIPYVRIGIQWVSISQIIVLRFKSLWGWNFGLKVETGALRLGFWPQDWDLGLKTGIWASRLGYGPQGWDMGLEAGGGGGTYYLRNKKVSTCNISWLIDIRMNINQLRIHEYFTLASFDWIIAAIHQGSCLQSFPKYSGVMAFQTFLEIFLIFSFGTFKLIAPKGFMQS